MNSGIRYGFRPASVSSTNASEVRTGNRGAVWPSRSVSPDGVRNFTAIPRTSGAWSYTRGLPAALDHRTRHRHRVALQVQQLATALPPRRTP